MLNHIYSIALTESSFLNKRTSPGDWGHIILFLQYLFIRCNYCQMPYVIYFSLACYFRTIKIFRIVILLQISFPAPSYLTIILFTKILTKIYQKQCWGCYVLHTLPCPMSSATHPNLQIWCEFNTFYLLLPTLVVWDFD